MREILSNMCVLIRDIIVADTEQVYDPGGFLSAG